MTLEGKRAVVLLADKFQDEEGVEPAEFLRERGAEVVVAGLKKGTVEGKYGRLNAEVTHTVDEIDPAAFDLLILPGGAAPETLRLNDRVLEIARAFMELPGKTVAAICHGPQILISARVLAGRTATCFAGIRDDVALAGARTVDRKVVVDGRLITSRKPDDIPAFNEAILAALSGEGKTSAPEEVDVDETELDEEVTFDDAAPEEAPEFEPEAAAEFEPDPADEPEPETTGDAAPTPAS